MRHYRSRARIATAWLGVVGSVALAQDLVHPRNALPDTHAHTRPRTATPQGGGFDEHGWHAPTSQLGGCFDGYGQTGPEFAHTTAPQMAAIRNMIVALGGDAYAPRQWAPQTRDGGGLHDVR